MGERKPRMKTVVRYLGEVKDRLEAMLVIIGKELDNPSHNEGRIVELQENSRMIERAVESIEDAEHALDPLF